MTGRRAGYCAGYGVPGYANPGAGWGFGRGFGWHGRGWGRCACGPAWDVLPFGPRMTREQETDWLKARAEDLQEMLKRINDRLNELEEE